MTTLRNFYHVPDIASGSEVLEPLLQRTGVTIERIVSNQASSPPGFWYDQDTDEWVILLKGTAVLSMESGASVSLSAGDYLFIPKHQKHRVETTSSDALWLAVHLAAPESINGSSSDTTLSQTKE